MRFAKAHGTGNDFVVLPDPDGVLDLPPELVAALCNRRTGIGGDGVLRVVRSAKHPDGAGLAAEAEWFMDYRNADGSVAEMCGNGVRAYVRYLIGSGLAPAGTDRLTLATRAGAVPVTVDGDTVTVGLARPVLGSPGTATVGNAILEGVAVTVGNPHLVCPVPDVATLNALDLGRPPGHNAAAFPEGVNVEFVAPAVPVAGADLHVLMRVHERGSGETLSCGSGACAVAAATLRDAGREDGTVAVDVPGGRLVVTLDGDECRLAGPAVVVATGEVDLAALTARV